MSVDIRWLVRRDMPEVLEIDSQYDLERWDESVWIEHLRQRNCIGMVAETGTRICGVMLYELMPTRLHLIRLRVHQDFAFGGIGRAMMERIQGKLTTERRNRITVAVPETNLPGHLFLRTMGFRCIGIRFDQYDFVYRVQSSVPT